jgi:methylglutaconyl-CoA hydratase
MSSVVRYEVHSPAMVLTLERPDRRNALNRQLIADLTAAVQQAIVDKAGRCIILTGAGSAFCAGMDLAELSAALDQPGEAEQVHQDASKLATLYELIYASPKPTIAAINGPAVAGGAGLMTVCDLAVAVPAANFGYPEVRRGLIAAMVLPHLLRYVGQRTARELLLRGTLLDATQALAAGLINVVVEQDKLMETALQWARDISDGGPEALAATKRLLREAAPISPAVWEVCRQESADARLRPEAKTGLRAFLEKRANPWQVS